MAVKAVYSDLFHIHHRFLCEFDVPHIQGSVLAVLSTQNQSGFRGNLQIGCTFIYLAGIF
jgi:hypothetical protein